MKNCIKLLLVTSLVLGLTACNEEKKNNVNTDYRVDANPEIRNSAVPHTQPLPEQQTQHMTPEVYDNRQVHQVANARFEREAAYRQRERMQDRDRMQANTPSTSTGKKGNQQVKNKSNYQVVRPENNKTYRPSRTEGAYSAQAYRREEQYSPDRVGEDKEKVK